MRILNKKELDRIMKILKDYYKMREIPLNLKDFIFVINKDNKIFIFRKEVQNFLKKVKVDPSNNGLYILKIEDDGIRFSIEGSQIFGPYAEGKVIEVDLEEVFRSSESERRVELSLEEGFYIAKRGNDFGGSVKIKKNKMKDFIPKDRKIYT
ncbi:hypothetical protein BA065_02825 [Nanoarchaeota archaeon NZ13-N]|uniref:rRNA small subunit methyltransferase F RNA-binding PUA-like domain-containing protein n=1 Tax=Candidatus Nanoclepta minutus TaxID=1940235 RepID=A0A397WMY3_9ARCH|nr:MAG: hypothetical protein BA065_02825 [Nanoarchaeota archaeon NZ13-N]RIB35261.1 MAG: hypothetical protein BXU00_01880 [Candidatus Nanoclepta minutus]